MLRSMTGYGRGEAKSREYGMLVVEIQGINRKYCDIHVHLPHQLLSLEPEIRRIIQKHIARGRINVFVSLSSDARKGKIHIDKTLIKQYLRTLKGLKKELKLAGELDLNLIAGLKDIIIQPGVELNPNLAWPPMERALTEGIKKFNETRQKEGAGIARQMKTLLADIKIYVDKIEKIMPRLADHFKERLLHRIREAGVNISDQDERVQKEVAIMAENEDISEELQRSKAHLKTFAGLFNKNQVVGRTMDFVSQELLREVNTIGSKALHTEVSPHVIHIKSQLEKIREQIQNIE